MATVGRHNAGLQGQAGVGVDVDGAVGACQADGLVGGDVGCYTQFAIVGQFDAVVHTAQ